MVGSVQSQHVPYATALAVNVILWVNVPVCKVAQSGAASITLSVRYQGPDLARPAAGFCVGELSHAR
jgi:hypothetical protein